MEYIFSIAIVLALLLNYFFNPAYLGVKEVTENHVYIFLDGVADLKDLCKVNIFMSGFKLPKRKEKIYYFRY